MHKLDEKYAQGSWYPPRKPSQAWRPLKNVKITSSLPKQKEKDIEAAYLQALFEVASA